MRKMNRVVPLVQNHPVKLCLQGAGADGIIHIPVDTVKICLGNHILCFAE